MFKVILFGELRAKGVIFAVEDGKISRKGTFTNRCKTAGLDIGVDFSAEIGESYMTNKEDFAGNSSCKTVEVAILGGGSLSICSSGDGPPHNTQWAAGPIVGTSFSVTLDSICVTDVFWD